MRRRTLFKLLCAATLLLLALPPALSILALKQAENDERIHMAATIADATLLHAENIFGDAESALRKLARLTDARTGKNSIEALATFVYAQKYLRGIGVIQNGRVVATNRGRLASPRTVRPARRGEFPPGRLTILPPGPTLGGADSIVTIWPVRPGASLAAAINPALLDDVVWMMANRDHVHLRVRVRAGARLAEFGAPMPAPPTMTVTRESSRFPIAVDAWVGKARIGHTLNRHGWFAAAPGVLLDVLLVGMLVYFFRRISTLESDLREATSFNEVFPEYQPQCDLATGACVGAEVLMRWHHPTRGAVAPDVFIPSAERLGLIRPLTLTLARRVAADLGPWISRHPAVHVSLNLGVEHCRDEDAAREIDRPLRAAIPARQLVYEVTERGLLERSAAPGLVRLESFAGEGAAALALDDFGTGYSSLGCLNQFRFQYLKIDKSFVDGIRDAHTCEGTLDQVITLARSLGLTLIAEGVEHEWQAAYLRGRGVTIGQGWLYSPPLNAADFRRFVEERAARS